ncbi:hypothetical protein MM300_06765 [Evansella sp. LMS18]|uniref:CBO0543 family protein n=1 Tax=Evansella sp. LMS18 TaxID=2924033 RepID=UPI0020CFE8CF|nr:CBO0543 family protein [Evansella sp. LMS18]UTR11991.1 hypothetical protein MM300_06765 [Evansella sp. LMS18]
MFNLFEKKLLKILLFIGIIMTPFSLFGKEYKKWIIAYLLNAYANTFIAPAAAEKGFLNYPVRFVPKVYKSSIIYDYCLCSLVTVWYCRSSMKDNWKTSFWKVWLFVLPQVFAETWLEKNTQLIKYNKGWTSIHSLVTIAAAKLSIRYFLTFLEKFEGRKQKEWTANKVYVE